MKPSRHPAFWPIVTTVFVAALLLVFSLLRHLPAASNSSSTDPAAISADGSPTPPAHPAEAKPAPGKGEPRRQPRQDPAAQVKALAARLIPIALKSTSGAQPDAADQAATAALLEELAGFDSARFSLLIAEMSRSPELDDPARAQTCGYLLTLMANVDPAAALDLFTGMQPLLKNDPQAGVSVITLLDTVSGADPVKAADWLARHPGLLGDGPQLDAAQSRILQGAAARDPALALSLMDRMQVANPGEALNGIASAAHTTAQRLSLLTALRNQAAATTDSAATAALQSALLTAMGRTMTRDPATRTQEFLDAAHLNEADQATLLKARDRK